MALDDPNSEPNDDAEPTGAAAPDPNQAIRATVRFDIDVDPTSSMPRLLNLNMSQTALVDPLGKITTIVEGPDGVLPSYISIPENRYVILTLELSDQWSWEFGNHPFTLKVGGHSGCFHRDHSVPRTTSVVIHAKPTGSPPVMRDNPANDQFFNLHVQFTQSHGPAIPMRIDPVIKNPPPSAQLFSSSVPLGMVVPIR